MLIAEDWGPIRLPPGWSPSRQPAPDGSSRTSPNAWRPPRPALPRRPPEGRRQSPSERDGEQLSAARKRGWLDSPSTRNMFMVDSVLLVDDMVDSRWSLTECGRLLRGAGSGSASGPGSPTPREAVDAGLGSDEHPQPGDRAPLFDACTAARRRPEAPDAERLGRCSATTTFRAGVKRPGALIGLEVADLSAALGLDVAATSPQARQPAQPVAASSRSTSSSHSRAAGSGC